MSIDHRDFRNALGFFTTGVTIITAVGIKGQFLGITANSFSSVSLSPPLILFSLDRRALSLADFLSTGHFAVNVLSADQKDLSSRFAKPMADKWTGVEYEIWDHGCPIIKGSHAVFECSIANTYAGGDHVILVGEVQRYEVNQRLDPLVYYRGQYRDLAPADAKTPEAHLDALDAVFASPFG
ncbi:MAG: flavin reductase family protein [Hyphomicrobiales bacterium]|nr:flavin reductase family protein [Hyphomicrobiales bacterium]